MMCGRVAARGGCGEILRPSSPHARSSLQWTTWSGCLSATCSAGLLIGRVMITVRVRVDDAPEEPVEVSRTDPVLRALRSVLNIPGTAQLPSPTVDRYL